LANIKLSCQARYILILTAKDQDLFDCCYHLCELALLT
jgi:hypothetical protein